MCKSPVVQSAVRPLHAARPPESTPLLIFQSPKEQVAFNEKSAGFTVHVVPVTSPVVNVHAVVELAPPVPVAAAPPFAAPPVASTEPLPPVPLLSSLELTQAQAQLAAMPVSKAKLTMLRVKD